MRDRCPDEGGDDRRRGTHQQTASRWPLAELASDHHRGNRYRLRNYCGRLGWLANTKRHVMYESWRERDHLIAFDFDPDVLEGAAQPFGLRFVSADGAEGLHTRTSSSVWSTVQRAARLGPLATGLPSP